MPGIHTYPLFQFSIPIVARRTWMEEEEEEADDHPFDSLRFFHNNLLVSDFSRPPLAPSTNQVLVLALV